jgi:hypothetical protein
MLLYPRRLSALGFTCLFIFIEQGRGMSRKSIDGYKPNLHYIYVTGETSGEFLREKLHSKKDDRFDLN